MNAATRRRVQIRAEFRCEYCRIREDDEPYAFHLEHIVPKKHDGSDDLANLAWSCQSCNLGKQKETKGDAARFRLPRRYNELPVPSA